MQCFNLKAGDNHIDNGYGHIYGVKSGRITNIDIHSDSPGEVVVSLKTSGFESESKIASIMIGNDGHGRVDGLDVLFGYGDVIVISGLPVENGNKSVVRCYYE